MKTEEVIVYADPEINQRNSETTCEACITCSDSYEKAKRQTTKDRLVDGLKQHERPHKGIGGIKRQKEVIKIEPVVGTENRVAYRFVKRLFDIVFSTFVLIAFCWLFVMIAVLIKLENPRGPILFKQTRVGINGKTFQMLKFRSMCVDAEKKLEELKYLNEKTGPVFKIADDPRVTCVGKILRKLSLDELPQFINVLISDMSIVGPRPALPDEVKSYNNHQQQRLIVKPGITCYWQTRRNRDSISFEEWVDLDLLYIKKCSVWTDLKIIVQTIGVVLTAQGS